MSTGNVLARFFEPRSVAVLGSFREGLFGGHVVVKTLLEAGFAGKIFPVNPSYQEVLGKQVYPSVTVIPEEVDLALVMIGCRSVPGVLRECAQKGIQAVVVVADGFAERDEAGAKLQEEIVALARRAEMRLIGPNTAGVANPAIGFNPCPYTAGYFRIKAGPVAISAQTGMINPQAFPYPDFRLGISKICDFGNKCDVDESDLLAYLENDPATGVITMYMESVRDGHRFLEIARRVAAKKPVLVLKSGRTQEGARAAASHTGSLAVDDRVFEAACRQAGVIRLERFNELFELPKIFAHQPLPEGNQLGIISFTGGVGVLSTDEGAKYGLEIARLTPGTVSKLEEIFPGLGKIPVDIGPMVAYKNDFMLLYPKIVDTVLADNNVDCLFNVLWLDPTRTTMEGYLETYAELQGCKKPVATWIYSPDAQARAELTLRLEDLGFPVFNELETAIKALGITCRYVQRRREEV